MAIFLYGLGSRNGNNLNAVLRCSEGSFLGLSSRMHTFQLSRGVCNTSVHATSGVCVCHITPSSCNCVYARTLLMCVNFVFAPGVRPPRVLRQATAPLPSAGCFSTEGAFGRQTG